MEDKVELLNRRCSELGKSLDGALFKASVLRTRLSELELRAEGRRGEPHEEKDVGSGTTRETERAQHPPDSQQSFESASAHRPSIPTLLKDRISGIKSKLAAIIKSALPCLPAQSPSDLSSTGEALTQSREGPTRPSQTRRSARTPPSFSPFPPAPTLPVRELNLATSSPAYQPVVSEVWDEKSKAMDTWEFMAVVCMPAYAPWSFEELHLTDTTSAPLFQQNLSSTFSTPPPPTSFETLKPALRPLPRFGTAFPLYTPQTVQDRGFVDSKWTTCEVQAFVITTMDTYSSWSFEELRLADYGDRRRYSSQYAFLNFSSGPTFDELLRRAPPHPSTTFAPPKDFKLSLGPPLPSPPTPRPRRKYLDLPPTPQPTPREGSFSGTFDFRCSTSPPTLPIDRTTPSFLSATTASTLAMDAFLERLRNPVEVEGRFVVGSSPFRARRMSERAGRTDGGRRRGVGG